MQNHLKNQKIKNTKARHGENMGENQKVIDNMQKRIGEKDKIISERKTKL